MKRPCHGTTQLQIWHDQHWSAVLRPACLRGCAQVQELLSDGVIMRHTGVDEAEKLEAGTTIWCTGIKINPVAAQLADALPAGTQARLSP